MLKKQKLATKIGLGFGVIVVLLGLVAWLGNLGTRQGLQELVEYRALAREQILASVLYEQFLLVRLDNKERFISQSEAALKSYETNKAHMFELLTQAKKDISDPERAKQISVFEENFIIYDKNVREALAVKAAQTNDAAQARDAYAAVARSGEEMTRATDEITKSVTEAQIKLGTHLQARAQQTVRLILTVSGGALVFGILAAVLLIRAIVRPIKAIIEDLLSGADQTATAAGQVSAASQTLAEGASEQAASLEETSSSLEEMSSMTRRNAENAEKANELAKQTRAAADSGATDMEAMSTAMEAIKTSSADIAKIIKTIDEIAFQTNILALNAAVEAARAGEAGMGFGVVAEEVRNLAQRSAQAAKETAAKIEGAITKTEHGVRISAKVGQSLQEIVDKVRKVDDLVGEVTAASKEQSQGLGQVNVAVTQMDKVTQSNAATAEESASAAEELNAQADVLKEAVEQLLSVVEGQSGNHGRQPAPMPGREIRAKGLKPGNKTLKPILPETGPRTAPSAAYAPHSVILQGDSRLNRGNPANGAGALGKGEFADW